MRFKKIGPIIKNKKYKIKRWFRKHSESILFIILLIIPLSIMLHPLWTTK